MNGRFFSWYFSLFSFHYNVRILFIKILGTISGNLTVVPTTIKANAAYSFVIDTSTIIPAGGYLTLTFPTQVTLSASPACTFQFGFTGTPVCSASGNILTISGGFPSLNGIRFRVTPIGNPGSAMNVQNFIFKFYSSLTSTTPLDQSSPSAFFFQYSTDTLSAAQITPGSWIVGDTTDWTISITPKNQIPAGGLVKLFMPKWNIPSLFSISAQSMMTSGSNTCTPVSGLVSASLSCSFVVDPIATNSDVLIIQNAFAAIQSPMNTFVIKVAGVRNMPTTRPYSNFDVSTYDASSFGIDNLIGLEVAMTIPATLPSSQVKVIIDAPITVDAKTTYLFTLFINNPIPMGGKIRVLIPSEVGATYLTQVIAEQRINAAVTVAPVNSIDPNYVELSGGYPGIIDSVPIAGLVAFRLKYLRNPSKSTASASFQITTYDSIYPIEQITTGLVVIGATGVITMNSFSYSETQVLEFNSFTYDITLTNALQQGCTIEVTFPREFIVNDVSIGNCNLIGTYGLSASHTCAITSNKLTIQNPFGAVDSSCGERIKFTVANNYIQNPTSTRSTLTVFSVRTLSQSGNPIDTWTGTTFKATENALYYATVTSSSYVTGDYPVTYTFTLRTPHQVEQNAFIYVKFPLADAYVFDTSIAASKCSPLQTLLPARFSCTADQSQISVKGGFSSSICACTNDIQFSVGGIINPRSFKPTDTFTVGIYTYDNYLIYQKTSGIALAMTTAESISTFTVSQSSGLNGGMDNYLFSVQNRNEMQEGDYIFLYSPSEIQFTNQTVCAARSNVRGFFKCKYEAPNKMAIAFSFSRGRRILGTVSINQGFDFLLLNIMNPSSMAPSGMFQMVMYSMDDYLISNISAGPTITNSKAGNMSYLSIRPSVYQDGQWTNLTFTIIPTNYLQFMTLTIQVPNDMLIAQAVPNLCQAITAYTVSKLMTCDYISSTRTIRILNAFTLLTKSEYDLTSTLLKQIQITVGQFINPVGQTQSGNFIFTTYDKGGYVIDNWNASVSYVCSSLCAACDKDDYTRCTACKANTVYKLLYMGQCVQQCPAGATETETKCLICPTGCQECSSVNDTCILCKKGLLFLEGSCVLNCPTDYIFQAPASCIQPELPPVLPTSFVAMFQKTDNYQCFIFPFSSGSIIVAIILWIASCWSQRLVRNKRARLRQQQKNEDELFLTPIRIVEICIALISFIEVAGWVFFLYCMVHLSEKLPFYVICGALGLNLFLNFIMACGIMRSKENYDRYLQQYSEAYVCTYLMIKFFTLLISHKGFYFSYARYQRDRRRHSHFDFSYFDSGDEDGVSGLCFKFFFLASILLLHGAVIAACVLNYLTNELNHQLFCLDLDIIGMTTFQALLVLLTLLQCGGEQPGKVYPGRFGELDENSAYMDVSVPDVAPEIKVPAKANAVAEQKLKTSASNIKSKDDMEEEAVQVNRPDSGKLPPKKGKIQQDLSQIAILDDSGEMPDQDGPVPTLKSSVIHPTGTSKKGLQFKDREPMDNNFFDEEQQQDKPFKQRQNLGPRQSRIGRNSENDRISERETFEKPQGKGKNKASQSESLIKKRFEDQQLNDDIEEFEEDEEEEPENEDDQAEVIPKSAKKSPISKGNKSSKKKRNKSNMNKKENESDDTFNNGEYDNKAKQIGEKKQKKNNQKQKAIKEQGESSSESDQDLSQDDNFSVQQKSPIKSKPKKKKKQPFKQALEKDQENSEESEEVDDESEQQIASSKKKLPQKKKKKFKNKLSKDDSISEENEEESDQEPKEQSKTNKSSKKGKKRNEKKNTKNHVAQGTQYERISHNASSAGDDDIFADQQIPRFMKNNIDKGMRQLDAEIVDAEEPSYRNLVDQINHETKQDLNKQNDDQGLKSVYGSIPTQHIDHEEQQERVKDIEQPVMQQTFQVPSKSSQASTQQIYIQKEPIGEKVSAHYDIINASIPTLHDQQIMEHNGAQFGVIKHSLETHNDQISMNTKMNIGLEEGKSDHSPRKSIQPEFDIVTQIQAKSEKGVVYQKQEEDNISQIIQKLPSQNSQHAPSQASKIQKTNLAEPKIIQEVPHQLVEEKQVAKVQREKHSGISSNPKELQSNRETIIEPMREISSQPLQKPASRKNYIPEKEYSDQEEVEELKDEVNKDDIKPKTKIIFSDKSESSVEEMMEDTPSNYNILNGRLDEDSRGLHSMIYKALSKKILYQNMSGSQHPLPQGNEDHEARKITSKASERRLSMIGQKDQLKTKEAIEFIQDRETNLEKIDAQQSNNLRRSLEKHQRNASIEEIRSSNLLIQEGKYDFKNSSEINLALQSINHDI